MRTIKIIERATEDGEVVRGPETPLPLSALPIGDGGDHYIIYEPGDEIPGQTTQEV